jgi:hypothetical protein
MWHVWGYAQIMTRLHLILHPAPGLLDSFRLGWACPHMPRSTHGPTCGCGCDRGSTRYIPTSNGHFLIQSRTSVLTGSGIWFSYSGLQDAEGVAFRRPGGLVSKPVDRCVAKRRRDATRSILHGDLLAAGHHGHGLRGPVGRKISTRCSSTTVIVISSSVEHESCSTVA